MRRRRREELASSAVETMTARVAAVVVAEVQVLATTAETTDATFTCRSSPQLCLMLLRGELARVALVATGIRTVMVVKRPIRQRPRTSSRAQQPSRSLKSSCKLKCRPVSTGS